MGGAPRHSGFIPRLFWSRLNADGIGLPVDASFTGGGNDYACTTRPARPLPVTLNKTACPKQPPFARLNVLAWNNKAPASGPAFCWLSWSHEDSSGRVIHRGSRSARAVRHCWAAPCPPRAELVPFGDNGIPRGGTYCGASGEILRPPQDELVRRHSARMFSSIKNESVGIEDDQIPS